MARHHRDAEPHRARLWRHRRGHRLGGRERRHPRVDAEASTSAPEGGSIAALVRYARYLVRYARYTDPGTSKREVALCVAHGCSDSGSLAQPPPS